MQIGPPMPQTARHNSNALGLAAGRSWADDGAERQPRRTGQESEARGFASNSAGRGQRRKQPRKRHPVLSKADWGPLGKHPDLDAIVARQRLHLPLSGRLTAAVVNQAWKRCAAEHHPDRGGAHDTMQLVNGARDLLLGRGDC